LQHFGPVIAFVVTKLDRLARSLRDANDIIDDLTCREVKLSSGGPVHDPTDPVGRLLFNVLAMVAEFEADLIRSRTHEGMQVAKAAGRQRCKQPGLSKAQEKHLVEGHQRGERTKHCDRSLNTSASGGPRSTEQSSAPMTLPPKCSLSR
jgi:DNA invertase Pin-like site-specific DNA recombinase